MRVHPEAIEQLRGRLRTKAGAPLLVYSGWYAHAEGRRDSQQVDRRAGGTAGGVGAEGRQTAVGVAVDQTHPSILYRLEGEDAVGAHSPPAVAQANCQVGLRRHTLGPRSGTQEEVVARALDLPQSRAHGTAPMTTVHAEGSLVLPTLSTAMISTPFSSSPWMAPDSQTVGPALRPFRTATGIDRRDPVGSLGCGA